MKPTDAEIRRLRQMADSGELTLEESLGALIDLCDPQPGDLTVSLADLAEITVMRVKGELTIEEAKEMLRAVEEVMPP